MTLWRGIPFAAALLLFGGACGGGTSDDATAATLGEGFTISSDGDVVARLFIPVGALPPGASVSDVTVTELPTADFESDDGEVLAAFELEPSGTVFDEPVVFTFQVPVPTSGTMVVADLVPDNDQEPPEPLEILSGASDDDTLTLSLAVPHFSTIVVQNSTVYFDASIQHPAQVTVGQPFTGTFTVTRNGLVLRTNFLKLGFLQLAFTTRDPWVLSGHIGSTGNFTPDNVDDRPPKTSVSTDTFTVIEQFTCTAPVASGDLRYSATVSYSRGARNLYKDGTTREFPTRSAWGWITVHTTKIPCVAPATTTSSTSTTTTKPPTTTTKSVASAGTRKTIPADFTATAESSTFCTAFSDTLEVIYGEDNTGTIGWLGVEGIPFTMTDELLLAELVTPVEEDPGTVTRDLFAIDFTTGEITVAFEVIPAEAGLSCRYTATVDPDQLAALPPAGG